MHWPVDPARSSVTFSLRHGGVPTLGGRFAVVRGWVDADAAGHPAAVEARADAAGVTEAGGSPAGSRQVRALFDAERHSTITLRGTVVASGERPGGAVRGTLTIRGETYPVVFAFAAASPITDPDGRARTGGVALGPFQIPPWWTRGQDHGGSALGDELLFTLQLEAVDPAGAASPPARVVP